MERLCVRGVHGSCCNVADGGCAKRPPHFVHFGYEGTYQYYWHSVCKGTSTVNPNSDLSQTSHCNIKGLSVSEVMRIENMITQVKFS